MPILTANQLKQHVPHVEANDQEDQQTMEWAVNATNIAIRNYCGRSFETTTSASASAREYRPKSWSIVKTHDFHTTDGLVVKTGDGDGTYGTTLTLGTDFILEPLNGLDDAGLTVPYNRIRGYSSCFSTDEHPTVQVTAAWGWAEVPDPVFQAALLKATRLWKRKDSPEGVLGGFQNFTDITVRISTREDPDVVELLKYYRTPEMQLLV